MYGTVYWILVQGEGVNWQRERFSYYETLVKHFHIQVRVFFSSPSPPPFSLISAETFSTYVPRPTPPGISMLGWIQEEKKEVTACSGMIWAEGCSRWGLIVELYHRNQTHREDWMPGWLWQVSNCGTEVRIPLSTTEGKASLGDSVCREHHVRAWRCLHLEQRRCDSDKWERRNWPLYRLFCGFN